MVRQVVPASVIASVAAHGRMTIPESRQHGSLEVAGTECGFEDGDFMCSYFTNHISIKGATTICDKNLVTWWPKNWDQDQSPYEDCLCKSGCQWLDNTMTNPWRAPGTAPNLSPCGMAYRNNDDKTFGDGRDLPKTSRTLWQRGATVEVAWAAQLNHGGGYAYRLCPSGEEQTESCFQEGHLAFADDTTTVQFVDGSTQSISGTRITKGTHPAGSHWKKNPIPDSVWSGSNPYLKPPFPEGVDSNWRFSLVDQVVIPKDLPLGDYVISWRWDCEATHEVWNNCGDITITDGGPGPAPTPAPTPRPSPTPTPTPSDCPGGSLDACIALCPTSPDAVYVSCVKNCGVKCGADGEALV